MRLLVYDVLVNVNGIYIMCMYVNKRTELVQRGIALYKMYVLLLLFIIMMIAFIWRSSPLSSRLTVLACDAT